MSLRRGEQLLRLRRGEGDRLFAEHVLARLERADRPRDVQMVGEWIINRLDLRVGQQRGVGAVARGMPNFAAAASARDCSREAMATISQSSACCIAGMTLFTPMAAVLNTPQRTFCITCLLSSSRVTRFPVLGSVLASNCGHWQVAA